MAYRSTGQKVETMSNFTNEVSVAAEKLKRVVVHSPLQYNTLLSEEFGCRVFLKREDLQVVRSYKLRGAYNKIVSLTATEQQRGVVCASAGNHAQGVAYACAQLRIKASIFMPATTPSQKVSQVRFFGKEYVDVILVGDTFDDAYGHSLKFSTANNSVFIHPFDDEEVICGQATVGLEILHDCNEAIDFLFLPVGGGGLAAGVGMYFFELSTETKIIGAEPAGAPSMKKALEAGQPVELVEMDRFVDGAAVKKVGAKTFELCKDFLSDVVLVDEGKICTDMLDLYNRQAIVVEPAGVLSVAALDQYRNQIKGKTVVCVISGGNNDISRTEEIRERSLAWQGLKHFFLISFPQRAGALKEFVADVLGENDDIVHFEYIKKNNREKGPALIGLELKHKDDLAGLKQRLEAHGFPYKYLRPDDALLNYLR